MARLTDPDRLAAYLDALGNWNVEGYVRFELNEPSHRWIERNLGSLQYRDIKQLMHDYVVIKGGEIDEVAEKPDWVERYGYEFHHDLRFTIQGVPVFIETRLKYRPPFTADEPEIIVVSVHDQ